MYCYKALKIKGKRIDEHRLVMERHLGRQLESSQVVHHINGNTRDNSIINLQIMSRSEHVKLHFPDFGNEPTEIKRLRGIKGSHYVILTIEDVQNIVQLLKEGYRQKVVAEMFNVSRRTIGRIRHKQHWSFSTCSIY